MAAQGFQRLIKPLDRSRREAQRHLIKQHHTGVRDQRARNCHCLTLPARKRAGFLVERVDRHVDLRHQGTAARLDLVARHDLVKGFAIGRTIFGDAARGWLAGKLTDDQAVQDMATKYARLCGIWDAARKGAQP